MVHHCPLNKFPFTSYRILLKDQAYFAHHNSLSERAEVQTQHNNNKKSYPIQALYVSWVYILRTMTNHPLYSILFRSSEYWRWCLVGWLCWLIAFRITNVSCTTTRLNKISTLLSRTHKMLATNTGATTSSSLRPVPFVQCRWYYIVVVILHLSAVKLTKNVYSSFCGGGVDGLMDPFINL